MSAFAGPEIVNDQLMLCLDGANIKSYPGTGTAWADISPEGKSATLTNGPIYSSNNGGFFSFDGTNDYAIISNIRELDGLSNYTASIWVRIDSSMTGIDCRFFWHGNYGALFYKRTSDEIRVYMLINDPGVVVEATIGTCQFNTWFNLVGTYDGAGVNSYVNGQLITRQLFSGTLKAANNPNRFLVGGAVGSYHTKCDIANVLIYRKTLTDEEIMRSFNATRGRFGL